MKSIRNLLSFITAAVALSLLTACGGGSDKALLPNVSGKAGEMPKEFRRNVQMRSLP